MSLSSYEKGLWFPKGAMPDNKGAGLQEDELWQADLEQAEVGYRYVFSQNIEGLNVEGGKSSSVAEESSKSYAPPFSVETVTIVVTQSGVKYFGWNNLSEKVATVADNTKLAPFDFIIMHHRDNQLVTRQNIITVLLMHIWDIRIFQHMKNRKMHGWFQHGFLQLERILMEKIMMTSTLFLMHLKAE